MNVKSAALRVTNKRLKTELKQYKHMIVLKNNANLSLAARKDAYSNLISHLEDNIENQLNENKYLEKENTVWKGMYYNLLEKDLCLEKDLALAKTETVYTKNLTKKYEENIDRLSIAIAKLTKENEIFMGKSIASKIKNIFKKR